jgi:hypothetical protein
MTFLSVALVAPSSAGAAFCADEWGYEKPVEVKPMRAVAQPIKAPAGAAAPKSGAAKPIVAARVAPTAPRTTPKPAGANGAAGTPSVASSKADYAAACWAQIYQLSSGKKLTDEQKKRLKDVVSKAPKGQAVTVFWPRLTEYLVAHPEQKENYIRLLRALLRWRARTLLATAGGAAPSVVAKEEAGLIGEVLGPERVAVQGSPAFSEEAVEAYADMACFLYEQNNPGKTIDAFDNRAMFASVVCEKFRNAPTEKDKRAMAAFDLSWAKFKVAWESADEGKRKEMLSLLQKSGAGAAGAGSNDPVLKSVLENWQI